MFSNDGAIGLSDLIETEARFKIGWTGGLPETKCGYGSTMRATRAQRAWIPDVLEEYNIKSIADIGAGDLNWIKWTKIPGDIEYTPYDLVPRKPDVKFFDITKSIPPKVDLIMCLWVINHLDYTKAQQAIKNIKASGSKYLLMTDRKKYYKDSPPEIHMDYIESITVSELGDTIRLIKL